MVGWLLGQEKRNKANTRRRSRKKGKERKLSSCRNLSTESRWGGQSRGLKQRKLLVSKIRHAKGTKVKKKGVKCSSIRAEKAERFKFSGIR